MNTVHGLATYVQLHLDVRWGDWYTFMLILPMLIYGKVGEDFLIRSFGPRLTIGLFIVGHPRQHFPVLLLQLFILLPLLFSDQN